MPLPNIFTSEVAESVIARINQLTPTSPPQWGKMSVDRMLAHLNVAYETIYEPGKHPAPNFFMKPILRLFVKPLVTGEKPMKKTVRLRPISSSLRTKISKRKKRGSSPSFARRNNWANNISTAKHRWASA